MKAAAIFSDNMVLQRNKPVRIFGTGNENEKITADILGNTAFAFVENGKWEIVLPPMKENKSCTLTVKSDSDTVVFKNVAVGEVWLAGGQSNMEFELQNDKNGFNALKTCADEDIRFYYTSKCSMLDENLYESEKNSCWKISSPENSKNWSAVGYYFARELSRKLNVTVGIIGCNWGGTSASAWISKDYLQRDERLLPYIQDYENAVKGKSAEQMIKEYDEYVIYQEQWDRKKDLCYMENPRIKWSEVIKICGENLYPGPMGCKNPMRPCGLYETMISRVKPYTLRGFLYYQGESDDHRPESYYALLSALIECWRKEWKDNLPFLNVQLPMFKYADDLDYKNWAEIRQAQMNVYKTVKNTGLAITLDCGEFNNIHPVDKEPVAHRLYLQALSEVYGIAEISETMPPIFREFYRKDDDIILMFDNPSDFDLKGDLKDFEISYGEEYFPANARIDGKCIILSAEHDREVKSVRYLWTNYTNITLYAANGLPVPPFKT